MLVASRCSHILCLNAIGDTIKRNVPSNIHDTTGMVSLARRAHLLNALLLEDVGELADLGQQFGVGDLALVFRVVAFPEKCDLK